MNHKLKSERRTLSRRGFLGLSAGGVAAACLRTRDALAAGTETPHFTATLAELADTHDLPFLSPWGPYSKKYFGVSHIPDIASGLLFDLSIFPTLAGASARLPNVTDPCGVHPWQAAPDLTFYSFRTELLWKDQVFCTTSFQPAGPRSRLIRIELVNNTASEHIIELHSLSQLCFPPLHELTAQPIRLSKVSLPPGGLWVDALDYADMHFAVPRPTDTLVTDGRWRGEERMDDSVGGSVLAQGFGLSVGDTILYAIHAPATYRDAALVFRFSASRGHTVTLHCSGLVTAPITLTGTGGFALASLPVGALSAGNYTLRLTSAGGNALVLNGFALVERGDIPVVVFSARPWYPHPQLLQGPNNSLLLKYEDVESWYGFALAPPMAAPQLVAWRDIDSTFGAKSGPDTQDRIFGRGNGRPGDPGSLFVHTSWPSVTLPASSRRTLFGLVTTGTESFVRSALGRFSFHPEANEVAFTRAQRRAFEPRSNPEGTPALLSQRLLAATTLTNVVYPLRTQRETIRDYSPGKIWDCLYTWDAGFIGLGLLELDLRAAIQSLNAYTTPAGSQSAFIHHGTPLPTQIYLFLELWNRTQSRPLLAYFYPRLRQYYLFLAGHFGSSTTRPHPDGLICTWDYFYNTGGWDDYPPQVYVHKNNLTSVIAPAVSTSHVIRTAKLLSQVARELGAHADLDIYAADIRQLTSSLQRDSWDQVSGYFGYARYDSSGAASGILRTSGGVNFNMGLDGVAPLIAGVCTPPQREAIVSNLFSPDRLWTPAGITTVDQQAPYYNPNGYWNGSVWFAHQWFLFKTMLDLGRADLACKIAQTGVDTWQKSTSASYDCMEHFSPHPPYGAGWCQFSSLSSPALSWFAALYTPGRMTAGFDVWLHTVQYDERRNSFTARLTAPQDASSTASDILLCLRPSDAYEVHWNGRRSSFTELHPGLLRIPIPSAPGTHSVAVTASHLRGRDLPLFMGDPETGYEV